MTCGHDSARREQPGTRPRLRCRVAEQAGFSLVELLIVLLVVAALLAIAVPSYLGFWDRANRAAAQADLRAALPAVAAYYNDHDSYAGLSVPELRTYDQGLSSRISVLSSSNGSFCLRSANGSDSYYMNGPGAAITDTACT